LDAGGGGEEGAEEGGAAHTLEIEPLVVVAAVRARGCVTAVHPQQLNDGRVVVALEMHHLPQHLMAFEGLLLPDPYTELSILLLHERLGLDRRTECTGGCHAIAVLVQALVVFLADLDRDALTALAGKSRHRTHTVREESARSPDLSITQLLPVRLEERQVEAVPIGARAVPPNGGIGHSDAKVVGRHQLSSSPTDARTRSQHSAGAGAKCFALRLQHCWGGHWAEACLTASGSRHGSILVAVSSGDRGALFVAGTLTVV
jgi:hypothetical protein